MTVQDLWTHPLKKVKESKIPLSTLKGKTIAVDISIWLHQIVGVIEEVSLFILNKPAYQPDRLVRELRRRHKVLDDAGLNPIYVFDGKRHPMKVVAREQRDTPQESAQEWLKEFYEKGKSDATISDQEREEALRKMKDASKITPAIIFMVVQWMKEESILFYCAPFEAEWLCVSFVLDSEADFVLSTDGDCVVLGAPKAVVELTLSSKQCCIYDRDAVLSSLTMEKYDLSANKDYLPEMAAFLGCDYIKRLHGNGPSTVFNKVLPGYREALDKQQYLCNLRGADQSYANRFQQVTNLYRYAPTLRRNKETSEWELRPLMPLSDNEIACWSEMIGFNDGSHPSELLPVDSSRYKEAMTFDGCSFIVDGGGPLPTFTEPMYNDNNTTLPPFAKLDFESIPICCHQSSVLHQFVAARHPHSLDEKCSRETLEQRVEEVKNHSIVEKDKVPRVIDRWRASNVLTGVDDDWNDEGCDNVIRSLAPIDEEKDIRRFYKNGNEANLERSRKLVDGGNILVRESLRCRRCRDNVDDKPKVLFQCDVVPHMKGGQNSKVKSENIDGRDRDFYTIFLCFEHGDDAESRRVCPYPYSCCGCHEGRYFCSHMLALLSVFSLKQQYPAELFELAYARSPLASQTMPLLIENIARRDCAKRKGMHMSAKPAAKKLQLPWFGKSSRK